MIDVTDRTDGTARATARRHRKLPVSSSVVSPSSVLAETAAFHEISPTDCRLIGPALNDTYLLRTRDDRFVARLYGVHRSHDDIHYELALLLHLAAKGVAVSTPVAAGDGTLSHAVHAPEGPRELVLFRYATGSAILWADETQCRRVGRLAADIHSGADDFEGPYSRPSLDAAHLIEAPLHAVLPLLGHRKDDQAYLERLATSLEAALEATADEINWGPCHGDFEAKNIHLAEVPTAIDFDLCAPGWRPYDLAPAYRATYMTGDIVSWQAFLSGYRERRDLTPVDLAAVPLLRAILHLARLGSYAANAERWGPLSDASLDRWLADFQWRDARSGPARVRSRSTRSPGSSVAPAARTVTPPEGTVKVSSSLLDPRALAAEIASRYPVARPVTCRLLHRRLNETYLVVSEGSRYVARLYCHGGRSRGAVAYELRFLAHLAKAGLGVPEPLACGDGEELVSIEAPEGTRHLVLFPYVPGPPVSWELADHGGLLGRTLARLHGSADGFQSRWPAPGADLGALIDRPLVALRRLLAHRRSVWHDVHKRAEVLRAQLQKRAGELDWGPCHGDFRPERVLLAHGRTATVVGFDQCAPGWRAWDFSIVAWSALDRADRSYWDAFIDGYTGVRPLGKADLELAQAFGDVRILWSLGIRAENAVIWGTRQVSDGVIDRELAALQSMRSAEAM